jgi:acyl-coenzyme A thioesterase PaaI-like protein
MLRFRHLLALVPAHSSCSTAERPAPSTLTLLAAIALLTLATPAARAQASAPATTLHLAANHFEFVVSGDSQAPAKPLRVHNGGTAGFTDVRLVGLAYADSARGAAWLVALPRQSAVAPDELATVGTLCVDATGLPAGTYRATAAVGAREVPQPVAITITLIVAEAGARARHAACGIPITK